MMVVSGLVVFIPLPNSWPGARTFFQPGAPIHTGSIVLIAGPAFAIQWLASGFRVGHAILAAAYATLGASLLRHGHTEAAVWTWSCTLMFGALAMLSYRVEPSADL
jgi:hypothetical protein